jgi:hypothetical protein
VLSFNRKVAELKQKSKDECARIGQKAAEDIEALVRAAPSAPDAEQ